MKTSKAIFSTLMFTVPLATTIVPSALNLNLNFETTLTVTQDGTSVDVIWVALPTSITKGKEFQATYIIADETTRQINVDGSEIQVGGKDIRNESGVEWKDGTITIPSSLVTANITIELITEDRTTYSVAKDPLTSSDVNITLPTKIAEGESINVTYTISSSRYLDWFNCDITVNDTSIKDYTGVNFKEGNLVIPSEFIDGPVVVKLVTCGSNYLITDSTDIDIACNIFERSDRTETDIATFLSSLTVTGKPTLTKLSDLLGVLIQFPINGKFHCAKIIDTQHDTLSESSTQQTAALTFDMVTLLSDEDGEPITSEWNQPDATDYLNSILKANLNGGDKKTISKSVLEMLPTHLLGIIKPVYKQVAVYDGGEFDITTYGDKLFPLSCREMNLATESAHQEGTQYVYWVEHPGSDYLIKTDVNGSAHDYWLVSPNINDYDNSFYVSDEGSLNNILTKNSFCISFGFCV